MLMINKSKVLMNSKDIKHDLCMVFHAIEDEFSVDYLGRLIVECLDLLAEFHKSEAGKNEEKSKNKIYKTSKVKEYNIKADNMQDALKQLEELDLPEEVKELARESLKD